MIWKILHTRGDQEPSKLAGKITGMLLEGVETVDLLSLPKNQEILTKKVEEALQVLHEVQ